MSAAAIEVIDKIVQTIDEVVVYKDAILAVRSLVVAYRGLLGDLSTNGADVSNLEHSLLLLLDTIKMATKDNWLQIALDWSVRRLPNELEKTMDDVYRKMLLLGLRSARPYSLAPGQLARDYQGVYLAFSGGSKVTARVQKKLDSITKCLEEENAVVPAAAEDELASIFDRVGQQNVRHSDFKIDGKIGFGATGTVYVARRLSNDMKVAIKELKASHLTEVDVESLRREIVALTSLTHPYLIGFIGATRTPPYWILTEYMPGKSLFHRLRGKPGLTGAQKTVIAYETAEGMAYLHSNDVIHRDLKSLNVLLDVNDEPKICDFGISRKVDPDAQMTGLIGTFCYMAPEVIKKARYSLKADVFSYGALLWEIASGLVPYDEYNGDQVAIAMAITQGIRPKISDDVDPGMRRLMEDCWAAAPQERPDFDTILKRMRNEMLCFAGADEDKIHEFYDAKSGREPMEGESTLVMKLMDAPSPELIQVLQKVNDSPDEIARLKTHRFVSKATPLLAKIDGGVILAYTLMCVMDSAELVGHFLEFGGVVAICELLHSADTDNIKYGCALVNHCINLLEQKDGETLVEPLLCASQWDTAAILLQRFQIEATDAITARLPAILESVGDNEYCAVLLAHVSPGSIPMEMMTPRLALASRSVSFVEKLLKMPSFARRVDDSCVRLVVDAVINAQEEKNLKLCALKLATSFGPSLSVQLANENRFVRKIIQIDDLQLVCGVLGAISRFQNGASLVFRESEFLATNIGHESVLCLFISLANFFPSECLKVPWLTSAIVKCLKSFCHIHIALKVLLVLSENQDLSSNEAVTAALLRLLRSAECNPAEKTTLIAVVLRISSNVSLIDVYGNLLEAAESGCGYAACAFRALSRQKLPSHTTRYANRLFDILAGFIAAPDEDRNIAAGDILLRMSRRANYVRRVTDAGLDVIISNCLVRTDSVDAFTVLLEALHALHIPISGDVKLAASAILQDPLVEESAAAKIRTIIN